MNSHLGLGVMINMLGDTGQETSDVLCSAIGDTILDIRLNEDELCLKFDGHTIAIYDNGQSCCEERYLHTDDHLASFVGSQFLGAQVVDALDVEEDYETHEVQFLNVKTSIGVFVVETHNRHNGYYGGFWIVARDRKENQ